MAMRRRDLLAGIGTAALLPVVPDAAWPARDARLDGGAGAGFLRLKAARFVMGIADGLRDRDWYNERPAHTVILSRDVWIAAEPVTLAEYQRFRPGYRPPVAGQRHVTGVTWHDAQAYLRWRSRRERRPCRLPTEAEWEHAVTSGLIRAGGGAAEPAEWLHDGFGPYRAEPQVDPLGYGDVPLRVVRGRWLTTRRQGWGEIDYDDPRARQAFPPDFGARDDGQGAFGHHGIGFRIVLADLPPTRALLPDVPLHRTGVVSVTPFAAQARAAQPVFRARPYLPTPPDDVANAAIDAVGLDASFRCHHHSPGITALANGDILVAIYTSYDEYEAGSSLIATRLRFGAESWDMPSQLVDMVGANDHAPLLMRDGTRIRLFWGSPFLGGASEANAGGFPFQWMESGNHGESWSPIRFPDVRGHVGGYSRQPINSAFRDARGRLLLASDAGRDPASGLGGGDQSMLWASDDNGRTWTDTGGRTFGRHTAFVADSAGRILGFGGKNSQFDGHMPVAISRDGGRSYEQGKTPFPPLATNQRPSLVKLASGRWLMIADGMTNRDHAAPVDGHGEPYVAVSADEGATWRFKALPGVHRSEVPAYARRMGAGTLGYCAATQADDGMIHVVTTMSRPSMHFCFNEAWLDLPEAATATAGAATAGTPLPPDQPVRIETFTERFADGRIKGRWSGGVAGAAGFVLHGPQRWHYPDGRLHWEVDYVLGRKTGIERRFDRQGRLQERWVHGNDGRSTWTRYWPNGKVRSQSHWQGMVALGQARCWNEQGALTGAFDLVGGTIPGTINAREAHGG